MIIGSKGEKMEFDFLSSIEILVLDKSHVFLMQNWDHVMHIMQHINLIPKHSHDTDFSRVKLEYLDDKMKHYRQTIIQSAILTPEINSLFNKSLNLKGKEKLGPEYKGSISDVAIQIPQVFQRINAPSALELDDIRFQTFIEKVLPSFTLKELLVYIPSYFDFVRIRNYLKSKDMNFAVLSEYTSNSEVSRTRTLFYQKRVDIVLMTERFYFYKRYILI
jgi:U3 small nucleolar RNA-associated protein 25